MRLLLNRANGSTESIDLLAPDGEVRVRAALAESRTLTGLGLRVGGRHWMLPIPATLLAECEGIDVIATGADVTITLRTSFAVLRVVSYGRGMDRVDLEPACHT